ncbi:hypothetical protein FNH05_04840 [Amycolatopsis rhizosphaerae]|uniref:FtsX extracellular domain-containing protein n=1 Tax=Amycolatopsis rhizosphaerae TaxID=2053003 RepID=A0A558DGS8_9PSEU|nr:permease-like cell division protein FtsX [Amycolatopsis rhizosphaerae]TVT60234.1 hypothetical protein FNH05_04840 [Amycolatopsis rhizosphaerae]
MRRIAEVLHDDHRVGRVYTETKDEAYQRFLKIFKDEPRLLAGARPEALPASATVVPFGQVDLRKWAVELWSTFPEASSIEPMIWAEIRATQAARYGTADLRPPCPPSGEYH